MNQLLDKTNKKSSTLIIKKETIEWIILCLVLAFSFINYITLLISLISLIILLFVLKQKEIGSIKLINIIALRTIINPGIAVGIDYYQNFKWIILLLSSFYLISKYKKLEGSQILKIKRIVITAFVFALYNILASLIFSTLPIVAIFKVISYILVFLGVLIGVACTSSRFNWINWLYKMFLTVIIVSAPLILFPVGYLRNGHSFQGITNQPNMFGIILTLFIGLIFTKIQYSNQKKHLKEYILLSLVFYFIILSKSRTAFITSLILLILFVFFSNISKIKKIFVIDLIGIILIIYTILNQNVFNFIKEFFLKGQNDFFYSRKLQVEGLMSNFLRNPLFGSGFAVPVTPVRIFSFSVEYVMEPGNLLLAVLSYGGVIGFTLFIIYISKILWSNKSNIRYQCYLPISTILTSMGEMVFFSSNNIGVWIYMYLAVYVLYEPNKNQKN